MRKLPGSGAQVAAVAIAHNVRGDLFPGPMFFGRLCLIGLELNVQAG